MGRLRLLRQSWIADPQYAGNDDQPAEDLIDHVHIFEDEADGRWYVVDKHAFGTVGAMPEDRNGSDFRRAGYTEGDIRCVSQAHDPARVMELEDLARPLVARAAAEREALLSLWREQPPA